MMNSQELETAVRLGMNLVVLILRDDGYGMIKWKQADMGFADWGLDYGNPDFVQYAASYGAYGHRIGAAGRAATDHARVPRRAGRPSDRGAGKLRGQSRPPRKGVDLSTVKKPCSVDNLHQPLRHGPFLGQGVDHGVDRKLEDAGRIAFGGKAHIPPNTRVGPRHRH